MISHDIRGFFYSDLLKNASEKLVHGISTKAHGNMSYFVGNANKDVISENRLRFFDSLNIQQSEIVTGEQVHSNNVYTVTSIDNPKNIPLTDALVSNVPNVYMEVRVGDCLPVMFFDPIKNVVGIAHSGWKGTVGKICVKTVEMMVTQFDSESKDILVFIGPGIGVCCYEVKEDVINEVRQKLPLYADSVLNYLVENDTTYFDMAKAVKLQLIEESGILDQHISMSEICTKDSPEQFYSYRNRGSAQNDGLFVAVIGIR